MWTWQPSPGLVRTDRWTDGWMAGERTAGLDSGDVQQMNGGVGSWTRAWKNNVHSSDPQEQQGLGGQEDVDQGSYSTKRPMATSEDLQGCMAKIGRPMHVAAISQALHKASLYGRGARKYPKSKWKILMTELCFVVRWDKERDLLDLLNTKQYVWRKPNTSTPPKTHQPYLLWSMVMVGLVRI